MAVAASAQPAHLGIILNPGGWLIGAARYNAIDGTSNSTYLQKETS